MSHLVISKKNEVFLKIEAEPHVYYELSDSFTFEVPGVKYMPSYQKKYWDGKIRLFNTQKGEIYVGLLDRVIQFCKDHDYNCLLYTSPSPRDVEESRMPSSA